MRSLVLSTAICLFAAALPADAAHLVLLHFSDYHSHAIPFFSDGKPDQGGLARAFGYLQREHNAGALVFDGGDMINKGSPAWSDKYRCAEWNLFNGVVDAMAFGNHDADYGVSEFQSCKASVKYPILSANTAGFGKTAVFTRDGIRVGVFALAGSDFASLAKGFTFTDRIAAARAAVAELRPKTDVIVMIGHESTGEDYELARTVPGIDLIFGTHSHLERQLTKIDGTSTWFISPYQYLLRISRVELTFDGKKLTGVDGTLVHVDSTLPADAKLAAKVETLKRELERDPVYARLFQPVSILPAPLSAREIGMLSVQVMKRIGKADVAFSTASTVRQDLPAGPITMEMLRNALPYNNRIVVSQMSGEQLRKLLAAADPNAGTDNELLHTPVDVDPAKTYTVATTDYVAAVSAYRQFFGPVTRTTQTIRRAVRHEWPAAAAGTEPVD